MEVISDGAPQFKCKAFEDFSKEWAFQHTVASPTHTQSNGKADSAVKNVENLLKKRGTVNLDEFWKGMLAIRNTPLSCTYGKSPTPFLFRRPLRDFLPRFPNCKE